MLRNLFFTVLASTALVATAQASDLGSRPPPAVPLSQAIASYDWTGFYAGATAGYVWGRDRMTDVAGYNGPAGSFTNHPDGGIFAVHGGYNLQNGRAVFGIEAELGYLGLSGSKQFPPYVGVRGPTDSVLSTHTDFFAAVTGRVGFTPADRFLVYGKGGVAFANLKTSFIDSDPAGTTLVAGTSKTRFAPGWTLGAGIEYAASGNWVGRLEYDHYDFGTQTHDALSAGAGVFPFRHRTSADTVRLGISYKLGGPQVSYSR